MIGGILKALSPHSVYTERLGRQADRLTEQVKLLERLLAAERAENARLVDELTAADARAVKTAGDCVCGGDAELHLRRRAVVAEQRAARDRANAVRLDNRLAAAEGRPVIGSLA